MSRKRKRESAIYVCFDEDSELFTVSTNLKGISEAIGASYYKLYRLLSNGSTTINFDNRYKIGKTGEIIKGKQRVKKKNELPDDLNNFLND